MAKKILITGGAGFIGSHLVRKLLDTYTDVEIKVLDNYFTGKKENHILHPSVEYVEGSTVDILRLIPNFQPETVFHLGEYSRIVKSFDDIEYCHYANVGGTFAVLQFMRQNGGKLIYAASSSILGNEGADRNLSPYAWMKGRNLELIDNMKNWYGGFDYAISYFFNVYGPGQITKGDYATVIGIFQEQVLAGKPISVVSPGEQRRDFTHVEDIVAGLILVSEKGSGDGYMLGTGKNYSITEIAQAFDHPWELVPARKGERFSGRAYESRAQTELGWSAKHDVIEYIKTWKDHQKGS